MTTPWMKTHSHEATEIKNKPREPYGPRTQREVDRKPPPVKFRFDETKIRLANEAYLTQKEETRMKANQYGYAGKLRRVEG